MRKIFSITVALLLAAAMLSSGALAQGAKESKSNMGTGRGQKQTQGDTVQGGLNRELAGKSNQKHMEVLADNPPADDTVMTDDDDDSTEEETPGEPKKDKEIKHNEKPQAGLGHGNAYGMKRNTQDVLEAIGQLAGENTSAQLNTLFSAYRDAADEETARTALAALLDALSQACLSTVSDENGTGTETQEPLSHMNIDNLWEKVLANAGNDNGTLLALMHAYENAFRYMNHLEPVEDTDDITETEDTTNTDDSTDVE